MRTDHRHDDEKVQREFERIGKKISQLQAALDALGKGPDGGAASSPVSGGRPTTPAGPPTPPTPPTPAQKLYELKSTDATIDVFIAVNNATLLRWDISRPLTIEHNWTDQLDTVGRTDNVRTINFVDYDRAMWTIWSDGAGRQNVYLNTGYVAAQYWWYAEQRDENIVVQSDDIRFREIFTFDNDRTGIPTYSQRVYFELDTTGGNSFLRGYVGSDTPPPPPGGMDDWIVAVDGKGSEVVSDGDTVTFTTSSVALDRTGRTISINYWFRVQVNGNVLDEEVVTHDKVVNHVQKRGIIIRQVDRTDGVDIEYEVSGEGPGGGGSSNRKIAVGIVELDNITPKAAGYHGDKCYGRIVHNWKLRNMHGYQLTLVEANYDPAVGGPTLWTHRGNGYAFDYREAGTGLQIKEGIIRAYSLRPFHTAYDRNEIRVYATLPRIPGATGGDAPTVLRFYYQLESLV